MIIDGQIINAKLSIKILGVILDQRLRYKEHILRARDKRIKAALALKWLKNLRPEVTKRLFYSKVTLGTDYPSPIWVPAVTQDTLKKLGKIKQIRAQAIIGVFGMVSLFIAKSKALLLPIQARLRQ